METRADQRDATPSKSSEKYDDLPGSTLREKIQNAHARLRATASAGPIPVVADSVTPSSAGDIEPAPLASIPQTTLPLSTRAHGDRADIPAPARGHTNTADVIVSPTLLFSEEPGVQTIHPSAIFEKTEDVRPGSLRLGPSEFALTLPMDAIRKSEYSELFKDKDHFKSVKLLLSGFKSAEGVEVPEVEQAQILSTIQGLVEKLDNVAVHTDLNMAASVKQSPAEPSEVATHAEYTSTKFQFLGQLIEFAGAQDLHILIMVRSGDSVDLVKRYCQGRGFIPTRPQNEMRGYIELSLLNGLLSVGILSTQHDSIVETSRPPAVIFALDSSFNASSPSVEHLRTTYARHGNLLPVVHLLISNSTEHIQRCLPNIPDRRARLKLLIHIAKSLKDFLGDIQDDGQGVQDNAEDIFTYLLSEDFNASWNLPVIEPIHLVPGDTQDEEGLGAQSTDPTSTASSAINKRMFDAMDTDTPDSKRQRLHMSQDLTQISESTAGPSQTVDLTRTLKAVEDRLVEMKAAHATEVKQLQTTISESAQELGKLQHRYESRSDEFHKMKKERDQVVEQNTKAEQKSTKQQEEITNLKDERTQLKNDLESARNDIKAEGGLKEELEKAREEVRELNVKNERLEKKAKYEQNQAEYIRNEYQNASSQASILGKEVKQLTEDNEKLTKKLAVDATKLAEIRKESDEDKHLARIKELEETLESREKLLRKKEEELGKIRNNRPATRATSTTPRSPKPSRGNGSRPTSPGINNGNRSSGLRYSDILG